MKSRKGERRQNKTFGAQAEKNCLRSFFVDHKGRPTAARNRPRCHLAGFWVWGACPQAFRWTATRRLMRDVKQTAETKNQEHASFSPFIFIALSLLPFKTVLKGIQEFFLIHVLVHIGKMGASLLFYLS